MATEVMSSECVFRSTDAGVLEAWAAMEVRWVEYDQACRMLAVELPDHGVLERQSFGGCSQFAGLAGAKSPGELWRLVQGRHNDFWWPSKRSKAGTALHEQMGAIRFDRVALAGMPHCFMDHETGHMVTCGAYLIDGTVWVHWNRPRSVVDPKVDLGLWEPMPLSQYHAAKEAQQPAGVGR